MSRAQEPLVRNECLAGEGGVLALLHSTMFPLEKLRLALATGQRVIIQFLFNKVLHPDPLFTDLANVRPRPLEYVSRAVVTHDSGLVENDADVNFTLAKKSRHLAASRPSSPHRQTSSLPLRAPSVSSPDFATTSARMRCALQIPRSSTISFTTSFKLLTIKFRPRRSRRTRPTGATGQPSCP